MATARVRAEFDRGRPAIGLHDEDGRAAELLCEPMLEAIEIAAHHGREISVHHRGRGSLVLPVFGADLVRLADRNALQPPRQNLSCPPLVSGIEEREQKADGDCLDVLAREHLGCPLDGTLIERHEDFALCSDALDGLKA